ncbi:ribonuclease P/MRP protein subunit POP5 isoform X2 [Alligator mississippiensis]|uniref:ribonuclease P/MRP protein subunit POP5 isoform X2 n=1 Tax=Alligator mississippiensis TaxID=8496 RepID=UPI0028778F25|nr:ribonuclease P/MRP protein subunit POP5 isoform X2 [Alligator mississippiensis]
MVRFKHRYLLCEVVAEDPRCRHCIDERAVTTAAKGALARAHGDYGLACCSIAFTGTIRSCQKFLIQYNRRQLVMLLNSCTNKEERESIQQSLLGCFLQEAEEEQFQSGEEEDDCADTD